MAVSFFGDFDTTETVVIPFNTFDSNDPSASVTATNLANTDVHIHKDGGLTQRSSAVGVAVDVDVDGIAGCHWVTIDLSDNTDAGFYADGSQFSVRVEGVTVDAATINPWIGAFTVGRTLRPTTAGRKLDVNATGEAGLDLDNTSGTIAAAQIATGAITAAKFAAGAIDAAALATDAVEEIADQVWDEILTGATHNIATSAGRRLRGLQDFGAYSGGFIYIDTVNGTAGTTDFENGVDSNPVDSLADANTIATSLGISQFKVAPGSTITLAATQANQVFQGEEWTLALGGQNIAGSYFEGALVSGTGTGANPHFHRCEIGTVTFAANRLGVCRFTGTITMSAASDYYWHDCYSGVAGAGTPVVDFGAAVGNTNLSMRRYSGGIQIDNKDATGTDQMSLEGDGQLVVDASSGGAISVRGNFKVTNTGGATITYDDNTQNLINALADTDELQADWTNGGRLDLILDAVAGDVVNLDGDAMRGTDSALLAANVPTNFADMSITVTTGLVDITQAAADKVWDTAARTLTASTNFNDLSAAEVNAEVLDVMNVDTLSLPGQAAPSNTPTHREALAWLYKAFRNRKTQTATQWSLLANDESTVDAKATVSDDATTAIKQEIVSGP